MINHIYKYTKRALSILILPLCILFAACIDEEHYENSRRGNFEALWTLIDQHYCFFDYKADTLGLDWNEVHQRYSSRINEKMTDLQFFEVMTDMLSELKDGHVNLGAAFDMGRNWSFREDYPTNYNDSIVTHIYLADKFSIASAISYRILPDNIGYLRLESFNDGLGDGNLSMLLDRLAMCNGLIIDVRNNGGGQISNAHKLAARFMNKRTLIGYVSHKTGKGHSDFSTPVAEYINPYKGLRWQKPVVVLTNRACYSATNDFVKCMRHAPLATIMGDRTGGGSGMPFTQQLPCGWTIRYSAVVYYDSQMRHTEFGIDPDVWVQMSGADTDNNRDTFIEKAREMLKE